VSKPENHGGIGLQCVQKISIVWQNLLNLLIFTNNLLQSYFNLVVLRKTLVVDALADNQESEGVHEESDEMSKVSLGSSILLLCLQNIRRNIKHELEELSDHL